MNELFSMQGRMGRGNYFLITVATTLAYLLVMFLVGFLLGTFRPELFVTEEDPLLITALTYILLIPYLIVIGVAKVKRLHDLDRPGSHYWLQLIPIYGIYLELVMLLKPGTYGTNRYDLSPTRPISEEALAV